MPFEKGDSRINRKGRPVGSGLIKAAEEKAKADGNLPAAEVWRELWRLYRASTDEKIKKDILIEMLPYCTPKFKAKDAPTSKSPEESKQKAQEAMDLLKALEEDANKKHKE